MKLALAFGLLTLSMPAFAGNVATLILRGTVPSVTNISVVSEAIAANLSFETAQANLKVGTVTESSNSSSGYKVKIVSTNLGQLKLNNTNYVVYTLTYGGQAVNLTSQQEFTSHENGTNQKELRISYSKPAESLEAGDYTDTLTFTITGN